MFRHACEFTQNPDVQLVHGHTSVCIKHTKENHDDNKCIPNYKLEGLGPDNQVDEKKDDTVLAGCGCCDESILIENAMEGEEKAVLRLEDTSFCQAPICTPYDDK